MNISIVPFRMAYYDEVLALWNECEGVGLSDADSRDNMAAYLERNPQMSLVAEGSCVSRLASSAPGSPPRHS